MNVNSKKTLETKDSVAAIETLDPRPLIIFKVIWLNLFSTASVIKPYRNPVFKCTGSR